VRPRIADATMIDVTDRLFRPLEGDMHRTIRRPASILLALVTILALAGCGASGSTASPSPRPSAAIATESATPTATPTPTPTPTASATPTAAPTPTPAEACAVEPESGPLVSDRMVDVVITEGPATDDVRFVFGNPSPDRPQGPAEGRLEAAEPPYTGAASGLPIELRGEHVIQVIFTGMSIVNDIGEPTYDGQLEFRTDLPALRDVVNFDMFEGHVSWYIAYDGPGCARLATDGRDIIVSIEHG
jgi:hypothetical protein